MTIVLTGAAGFIGFNLANRLLKMGKYVVGIDNFITGQRENIKELSKYKNFTFIEHDVIKPFKIDGKVDWIMHFACPASPPKYLAHPIETMRVNSDGTRNCLEIAKEKGAKFFLASTSEIYGDALVHPQPETYWGNVSSIGPRSVYDEGKRYAEAITMAYHNYYNLSTRIIRIFNTYGPHMALDDGRIITNCIKQILDNQPLKIYGDGNQTRSFQYVDDLIEGIIRFMNVEYYLPVNLGNPGEFKIIDVADFIKRTYDDIYDYRLEFFPLPTDDPKKRKPDISIAKSILKWEPTVKFEVGFKKTFDYFIEKKLQTNGE